MALPIFWGLLFLLLREPEPAYQGKRLSDWLMELNTPRKSAAQDAIRHIGRNAVPFLCRELLITDSNLKLKWQQVAGKQRLIHFKVVPAFDRHEHAREAIMILGPVARPAIPVLIEAFKQGNVGHRISPYDPFPSIGRESIAPLVAACTNENKWVQFFAVRALQTFTNDAPAVVPQLIRSLSSPDPRVRYGAITSLMHVRSLPDLAVPALAQTLADVDPGVRALAAYTLGLYGHEAETIKPVLEAAFEDNDPGVRGFAAWAMVKINPEEAKLLPRVSQVLQESLSSPDTSLSARARKVLEIIEPKTQVPDKVRKDD
jgi:HEAT repeat protein